MDYRKTGADSSTTTRDLRELEEKTGNIYESIAVVSKRANQIASDIREDIRQKLEEFQTNQPDNLEEIHENREQIDLSRMYERLPKPSLMAIKEFMDDKIYFRKPEQQEEKK